MAGTRRHERKHYYDLEAAKVCRLVISTLLVGSLFGAAVGAEESAPDLVITLFDKRNDLGTSQLRLSDLRSRPIVLNFWAGRCPPCRVEMPEFQSFYEEFKSQVVVLGVDVGLFTELGSHEDAKELVKELGITYPTGYSDDPEIMRRYNVFGMPTTFIIDKNGRIVRRWNGVLNRDKLVEITKSMLAQ
ncbi:MAG: TlpA family protein disulfide reductase [Acidiferrobacterales bacterium]